MKLDNYVLNLEAIKNSRSIIAFLYENPEMKVSINSYSNKNETVENISLKRDLETKSFLLKKELMHQDCQL